MPKRISRHRAPKLRGRRCHATRRLQYEDRKHDSNLYVMVLVDLVTKLFMKRLTWRTERLPSVPHPSEGQGGIGQSDMRSSAC